MISKTVILSTVINFELYKKTSKCFPKQMERIVIDGTQGMHGINSILYMFKKLKNQDIDWLVMADEDVIFENNNQVFELIAFMKKNNYVACGVRDGGVVAHRNYNPYAINTFFSIVKFNEIKNIFNKNEILKNQYYKSNEFSSEKLNLPYLYDENSLYEPYYCFYFWLLRKGKKILYLDSIMEQDNIANAIYFQGVKIATHTWYARGYKKVERHTKRINNYLKQCREDNFLKPKVYKSKSFILKKNSMKLLRKIKTIFGIK